jgi:hypothetical protein
MATTEFVSASEFALALESAAGSGDCLMLVPHVGICLANNPFQPLQRFDFQTEMFVPIAIGGGSAKAIISGETTRRTGEFEVSLLGQTIRSGSLKSLLAKFLQEIERHRPGTLSSLTEVKARTRRIVARKKEDLFDNPHLAEGFSEPLGNGWFVNTNNSKQQVQRWLEEATKAGGLEWGKDVVPRL